MTGGAQPLSPGMAAPVKPGLWLVARTRYALHRRAALLALAVLLAVSLLALRAPAPPPATGAPEARAEEQTDVVLYQSIVEQLRHGGLYYPTTATLLRAGNYPLKPFVTFRLPTLAVVQSLLPEPAVVALLYLLAAGTAYAWYRALAPAFTRAPPRAVAVLLLFAGLAVFVQEELRWFHEIWAGLLIALSLGCWRPGRWVEAVALGCAAALIREIAVLYLGVMLLAALADRRWREAIGWGVAIAVLAAALAAHAAAVARVVRLLDPASPGWHGLLGPGFFVRIMTISTSLRLAPPVLAAPLVALALWGWAAWRSPLALRVCGLFAAFALLLSLFGRVDTFYWGLLCAGLLPVGLAFVPDALRECLARRRRITIRRMA
ncbi:hypothetical protein SAMN06297144_0489 [Sphingomonas guangdongensis]|uniref:DUF2029 domain-containing protein n=1 Tax=Sphingomonas guangdongensis TaxID=1141890 RepID=A0A285QBQ5_9SPHN|nr:hypothetical protein [Sphingomonas guangdongensis]SOB79323.1 hypothetical protein SAMN06297144_0489 [Sphingomonas guangdongensis]